MSTGLPACKGVKQIESNAAAANEGRTPTRWRGSEECERQDARNAKVGGGCAEGPSSRGPRMNSTSRTGEMVRVTDTVPVTRASRPCERRPEGTILPVAQFRTSRHIPSAPHLPAGGRRQARPAEQI